MAEEELTKAFGWDGICSEGCHHPYHHSHGFTLGKNIQKMCSGCGVAMRPNAQRFGNIFGKNNVILDNFYQCTQCKKIDHDILYDGEPKDYDSIQVIVSKKLKHREAIS